MRQDQQTQTPFEIVTLALAEAHHLGKAGDQPGKRFHAENATRAVFGDLAKAGAIICPLECHRPSPSPFGIVPGTEGAYDMLGSLKLEPGTVEELPRGTTLCWNLPDAEALKMDSLLQGKTVPTGRILDVTYARPDGTVETISHTEFAMLDAVSFHPSAKLICAGSTILSATVRSVPLADLGAAPEPMTGAESVTLDPRAVAVRNLVEATRLIALATDVLGHDACDEILNNLPEFA